MSQFLATIRTDVPIDLKLDDLQVEEPNEAELAKILHELEFKTLANRILNKSKNSTKKTNKQLNLFEESSPNIQVEPKNKSFESLKTVPHEYKLIDNEEEMRKLCDFFLTNKILSLDTETTSTNAMEAELVGLSFSVAPHQAFYVPIPANREQAIKIVNLFKPAYENDAILKIGQNIKYDMEVLSRYGIELKGDLFDTMIAHYLLQPELHHNMDYMAEVYLRYQTIHIEELIGPCLLYTSPSPRD